MEDDVLEEDALDDALRDNPPSDAALDDALDNALDNALEVDDFFEYFVPAAERAEASQDFRIVTIECINSPVAE